MSRSRRLLLVCLALALCGCGFRLAGTAKLPPGLESIHLVTKNFNQAQLRALRERLENAGATVSMQPIDGAIRLSVALKPLPDRRVAAASSSGKKVGRVSLQLDFSVRGPKGAQLAPFKSLVQQQDIVLDDDNLLSSDEERKSVIEDLEKSLYNLLVQQLRRLEV